MNFPLCVRIRVFLNSIWWRYQMVCSSIVNNIILCLFSSRIQFTSLLLRRSVKRPFHRFIHKYLYYRRKMKKKAGRTMDGHVSESNILITQIVDEEQFGCCIVFFFCLVSAMSHVIWIIVTSMHRLQRSFSKYLCLSLCHVRVCLQFSPFSALSKCS